MSIEDLQYEGMNAGTTPDKFAFAAYLRKNATAEETKLWEFLKIKPNGIKFRRQHPFKYYILDFYCHKKKIAIELDGNHHKNQLEYDEDRTSIIESYGIKVYRFSNQEINRNFDEVKKTILTMLQS